MKRHGALSGFSLIELLVVTVVLMLSGLALVTFIRVTYGAQDLISGQNSADAMARQVLDTLADNIRDAQFYDTGVSTTSMVIRSASPPTATSITIYNVSSDDGAGVTDGT